MAPLWPQPPREGREEEGGRQHRTGVQILKKLWNRRQHNTRSGEGGQGGTKVDPAPQQGHSTPRIQEVRGGAGERRIWGREEPKDGPTLTWTVGTGQVRPPGPLNLAVEAYSLVRSSFSL